MPYSNNSPSKKTLDDLLNSLIITMSRTKSNRFRAAKRLGLEHDDITLIIMICSVGVIASSLLPLFFPECATHNMKSLLGFTNVVFSIFIIILTVLQDSKKRVLNIELFRRSGLELIEIIQKAKALLASSQLTQEDFNSIVIGYKNILTNYRASHEDVDDMINRAKWMDPCLSKVFNLARGIAYVNRYLIAFVVFCILLSSLILYVHNLT